MTEAMTAPESLEPEVQVTEADRRAAWDALYSTTPPVAERWISSGQWASPPTLPALRATNAAHAIARARTMGAFEERCRAARRVLVSEVLLSNVVDAPLAAVFDWFNALGGRAPADDDIRALVLRGMKGGK